MKHEIRRCNNCLISETFPGIKLSDKGVCNLCENFKPEKNIQLIEANRKKIDAIILENKGKGVYDAIVSYSGGKDSSYTLWYLKKKHDLNILALLIDNGFVSNQTWENARILTDRLNVDLVIFKPDSEFMHKMYKISIKEDDLYELSQLTRANAICLSCITLISNITLNEAIIRKIPMIAGGYIHGQMPAAGGVLRTGDRMFQLFREKNRKYLALKIDKKINRYMPINGPSGDREYPVIINPMLGVEYDEKKILRTISGYGWRKPSDTGLSSSNCQLNDYAIAVHYQKYKYHSYESEICMQIRKGLLSKKDALLKLTDIRSPDTFTDIISKLNQGR
jgi:tRNA(Ile)-lysidine synthase TilS/MesJ